MPYHHSIMLCVVLVLLAHLIAVEALKDNILHPLHEKIEYNVVTFSNHIFETYGLPKNIASITDWKSSDGFRSHRRGLKSLPVVSSAERSSDKKSAKDEEKASLNNRADVHDSHHSLHRHLHSFKLTTERPESLALPPLNCGWGKPRATPNPGRIIDIFMFNGEYDIVEARFYELNSTVDIFIVSEDEITFTGDRKVQTFPFLVEERLQQFKHKIVYLDGKINPNKQGMTSHDNRDAAFRVERGKRNSLIHFIPGGVKSTDYITMCDADELISEHWFRVLRHCDFGGKSVAFKASTSHYSLHHVARQHQFGVTGCIGSFLMSGHVLQECHKANSKAQYITPPHADEEMKYWLHHGWHMSYFGSPLWIQQKLNSYAETKTNRAPYNNIEYIKKHAYQGLDLLEQGCYNWTYKTKDEIMESKRGPWFFLANWKHRSSFARYANPNSETIDVHCLMLSEVSGGLGQQLFSIFSLFSRAYKLGIPFVLPFEAKNSKATAEYWNSELLKNLVTESYSPRDCSKPQLIVNNSPLDGIPENLPLDRTSVSITGSIFNKTDLKGEGLKNVLHNRLVTTSTLAWREKYPGRILMIGGPSSLDAHSSSVIQPWMDPKKTQVFIENALHKVEMPKYSSIHVFGDSSIDSLLPIIQKYVIHPNSIHIWKDSAQTITDQLGYMASCDDFIIGSSLVHFWGAFLSTSSDDKTVLYPAEYPQGHSFIPHAWIKVASS